MDPTESSPALDQTARRARPAGVRHTYPLAVGDAGFFTAAGLLRRTLPYALVRFGILLGVSVATIVWYAVAFGGWAWLATHVQKGIGVAWFLACCGVYGYFWWAAVRYFLYLLKCGHIVVLTDLITTGRIDDGGKGMFAYGKEVVKSRFGEVNVLFAVDLLVKGVVSALNRTLDFIAGLLPLPGLSSLASVANAVLRAATTYIDETVFSYGLARKETNPWLSARDGVVYYAQNSKEILKTAVWIVVLDKVLSAVIWVVMLAPAFALAAAMPGAGGSVWFALVAAALLASTIRSAFLRPLFLVMVMVKFHVQVREQPIDEAWEARLTGLSDKFRQLGTRAAAHLPATPAAA
jgi:hypothetical protein